jgi:excisionase family DNA binding protein
MSEFKDEIEILTIDELAKLLKMKRTQIYELTRRRSRLRQPVPLPALRINGNLRFRKSAVIQWLDDLAEVDRIECEKLKR